MPSSAYNQFVEAMAERKQILCVYDGYPRELCPIVLGHTKEQEEVALVYQFAGGSKGGLPRAGQWKCFRLSKVSDVKLRDGPWRTGSGHMQQQTCVADVDFDVNPQSPYNPRRRLTALRGPPRGRD
jgi:hypothetical protein